MFHYSLYNSEAQISFVEHNDLVLVCAIIKHVPETSKQNEYRIRSCSSGMLSSNESRQPGHNSRTQNCRHTLGKRLQGHNTATVFFL